MSDLSSLLAELSPEQYELLLHKLDGLDRKSPASIPRQSREVCQFPLSAAQKRIWFMEQLDADSPIYNISTAVRLTGHIDVNALNTAVHKIIERHETLRTTFPVINGQPVQSIAPTLTLTIPIIQREGLPDTEWVAEIKHLAEEDAKRPFDLASGPLLRITLLRFNDTEHALLLSVHHIIFDVWSMDIFIREFASLYHASATNKHVKLPTLPIQYADFTVWHQRWLQGDTRQKQLKYWQEHLSKTPSRLQLPRDYATPPIRTFRGKQTTFQISSELSTKLQRLCQQEGVTLFMLLFTTFQVLLYRYSGQEQINVGSPISGRNREEVTNLIGCFINVLVLHTDLAGNPTFLELLGRIRQTLLAAYDNQDIPFEEIVDALQLPRTLTQHPLFQVMFELHHPSSHLELPDLQIIPVPVNSAFAQFDLVFSMVNMQDGLRGTVDYSTELFDQITISQMVSHYQTLLDSVVAAPNQNISDLTMMTTAEKHRVLIAWNSTQQAFPPDQLLHHLFENQVKQTPEAIAVVYGEQQISYQALNHQANRLAHHLQACGVRAETVVGICVDHSLEMVICILGVLKAGGGFLPLDPAYPPERLNFMLADTQAPLVLTQSRLIPLFTISSKAQFMTLDAIWERSSAWVQEDLNTNTTAVNLAYIIYTSGSTGTPKGVMITHKAICNRIMDTSGYKIMPEDRILQHASFSFDASLWELFAPLTAGAHLVLADFDKQNDIVHLTECIAAQKISLAVFTPSLLRVFLDSQTQSHCDSLRYVFCGGEVLPLNLVDHFFTQLDAQLHNYYGPTEYAVDATYGVCEPSRRQVPIGRPIANTQVYLLDSHLQPVPIGLFGELYIGGAGLARGYLNQSGLTAAQFLPNPFSKTPGSRLYKTGDMARYLPDGCIDMHGRLDDQVKIGGVRIELQEIQAMLNQYPAVQESFVTVLNKTNDHHEHLVGYVVPKPDHSIVPSELYHFLAEKLPRYMIPSAFVPLTALPIMPNGKVDRHTLPLPEWSSQQSSNFVAPRTPTEELLAGIWNDLLGVKQVGIHDNFFELGGHSLLATQIVSRIIKTFQVKLPLHQIFKSPTVIDLAPVIQNGRRELQPLPAIKRADRSQPIPLSFAQHRMYFLNQLEPDNPFYNIPVAIRLVGSLKLTVLEDALNTIIQRHETLRTTFQFVDGQLVQLIAPKRPFALHTIDLSHLTDAERDNQVRKLAKDTSQYRFDLTNGPLWLVRLLQLNENEFVILFTIHHIISDEWSVGIFIDELAVLYDALVHSVPPSLPQLLIQYADFSLWQNAQWQQGVWAAQLNYWKEKLDGASFVLNLPTDRPRANRLSYRGKSQSFALTKPLTEQLKTLSRSEGVTLFMTLFTAFNILLYRYSGQEDIIVGTAVANRNQFEIESLIGFFINTLVLRTNLSGNPTVQDLLNRVRHITLEAYEHQDLPLEKLVSEIQPERDLSRNPLFQVVFVLQNTPMTALELEGLQLSPVAVENETAKFDLTAVMWDSESGLQGAIEYNTDLFDDTTIQRLIAHFHILLTGMVQNLQCCITQLPLLSDGERHQLIHEWTNPVTPAKETPCIQEIFEAQARRSPDITAVVYANQTATYQTLNERANQLAHYLQQTWDVQVETLVGIFLEPSIDMIVSILGILKAGAAYVPLDPTQPKERLAFMIADSQVSVLLTHTHLLPNLPQQDSHLATLPPTVCLDDEQTALLQASKQNPPTQTIGANLAYIIYTSGSTGKPKGVAVTHANVIRLFRQTDAWFHFDNRDTWTLFHSYTFDFSVWEIWGALFYGGQLVIVPAQTRRSPELFYQLLCQEQVTVLNQTPSAFQQLIKVEESTSPPTDNLALRYVIFGGEALNLTMLQSWYARHHDQSPRLVNMYGITETTVHVTYRPLREADVIQAQGSVIGSAIPDLQLYILDPQLQLVPIGVYGEVYVGGAGCARNYLNRAGLTASKFIPDFLSQKAGSRLYKTGDLARWLPNGDIEYLGRIDNQVKIRGFRIELGEIEMVLNQHPLIRNAVVTVQKGSLDHVWLVAYLTTQEPAPTIAVLRQYLSQKLPDYMIPATFVILDHFPLTLNGKINYLALPAPQSQRQQHDTTYVMPQTKIEQQLAAIWQKILQIDKAGLHDNFFELGGHSLLIIELQRSLEATFETTLSIVDVFQYPTVQALANRITQMQEQENPAHQIRVQHRHEGKTTAERQRQLRQRHRTTKKS